MRSETSSRSKKKSCCPYSCSYDYHDLDDWESSSTQQLKISLAWQSLCGPIFLNGKLVLVWLYSLLRHSWILCFKVYKTLILSLLFFLLWTFELNLKWESLKWRGRAMLTERYLPALLSLMQSEGFWVFEQHRWTCMQFSKNLTSNIMPKDYFMHRSNAYCFT